MDPTLETTAWRRRGRTSSRKGSSRTTRSRCRRCAPRPPASSVYGVPPDPVTPKQPNRRYSPYSLPQQTRLACSYLILYHFSGNFAAVRFPGRLRLADRGRWWAVAERPHLLGDPAPVGGGVPA